MAAMIAYLSLRTSSFDEFNFIINIPYEDKIAHIIMYIFLAISLCIASRKYIIIITISTIYGGIIELLQNYYFPPRTGEWLDLLSDFIGAIIGVVLFIFIQKKTFKKINNSNSKQ